MCLPALSTVSPLVILTLAVARNEDGSFHMAKKKRQMGLGALVTTLREKSEIRPRPLLQLDHEAVRACCLAGTPVPDKVTVTTTAVLDIANRWVEEHVIGDPEFQSDVAVLGFDVEWRPCRRKGEQPVVAVVQLAASAACLVFQILWADVDNEQLASSAWARVLSDSTVRKVGVGVHQDAFKLSESWGIDVMGRSELQDYANELEALAPCDANSLVGLKKLAKQFLGLELKKPKKITMSNWAQQCLSSSQSTYAAMDAFVSRAIFIALVDGTWAPNPAAVKRGICKADMRTAQEVAEKIRAEREHRRMMKQGGGKRMRNEDHEEPAAGSKRRSKPEALSD